MLLGQQHLNINHFGGVKMKKQLNILKELFSGWAIFGYIVTFFYCVQFTST